MEQKTKPISLYSRKTLKEIEKIVDLWLSDMETVLTLSEKAKENEDNIILKIAVEAAASDFEFDLDADIDTDDNDAQSVLESLIKYINEYIAANAVKLGWNRSGTLSALLYLSERGRLDLLKEYLEKVKKDIKEFGEDKKLCTT